MAAQENGFTGAEKLAELETEAAPMKGAEAQLAVTSEMAVPTDATDPEGVSVSLAEAADDLAATAVQKFKLHMAAQEGHVDVVRALLEGKADPNLAMIVAAQEGHVDVVRALLEGKADPSLARKDGITPLFIAALMGHVDVVRALLEGKADPNLAENKHGYTPLIMAAQEGHVDVVRALLEGKADPSLALKDGRTAAHVASQRKSKGHKQICVLLWRVARKSGRRDYTWHALALVAAVGVAWMWSSRRNCSK